MSTQISGLLRLVVRCTTFSHWEQSAYCGYPLCLSYTSNIRDRELVSLVYKFSHWEEKIIKSRINVLILNKAYLFQDLLYTLTWAWVSYRVRLWGGRLKPTWLLHLTYRRDVNSLGEKRNCGRLFYTVVILSQHHVSAYDSSVYSNCWLLELRHLDCRKRFP